MARKGNVGDTIKRSAGRKGGKRRKDLRGKVRGGLRLLSAAVAIAAVTRELRRPKSEREWHGEIAKVPYDFRAPTPRRLVRRSWAPDDPRIIVPRAFGVGWTLNIASVAKQIRKYRENSAGTQPRA